MDKDIYIQMISQLSDQYGNELVKMMNQYNKFSLRDITFHEAKEYYEQLQLTSTDV